MTFTTPLLLASLCFVGYYAWTAPQAPLPELHELQSHDDVPHDVRRFWMRRAIQALDELVSPCPAEAFGAVIVNHTTYLPGDIGDLVCIGANAISTGNPTLHGEMAAINNCTAVLADPKGHYKLSPSEIRTAWHQLTLYTTAEPCPMCSSAIRWAGFKECIYGTSAATLAAHSWNLINISSEIVFERSSHLKPSTRLVPTIANDETDPYFKWQNDPHADCPKGCARVAGTCAAAHSHGGP
jgi:tRNA(Arg) A34 adenosine deaminase TadA